MAHLLTLLTELSMLNIELRLSSTANRFFSLKYLSEMPLYFILSFSAIPFTDAKYFKGRVFWCLAINSRGRSIKCGFYYKFLIFRILHINTKSDILNEDIMNW